jgi:hypothetical protein
MFKAGILIDIDEIIGYEITDLEDDEDMIK